MEGRTDGHTYVHTYVCTDVYDVMAIKPNFSHIDGLPFFLSYGAPRARAPSASADLR